jgi:flagellar P-ring protein precursor FlgI
MVTANLPPYAAPGQNIDITVSSIGNAKSLRGGTLLMTPLKGADGQIYAIAQGNVLAPGISAGAAGSSVQVNQTAAGRIPGGAVIERTVPSTLAHDGEIELELKQADFETALNAMNAINRAFGRDVASAQNARTITLKAPYGNSAKVAFLARVGNIQVQPGPEKPRVIINSRTGSVVMNGTVTVNAAAVAHGNLSVVIQSNPIVSQPNPLSGGRTAVVPHADVNVHEGSGTLHLIPKTTSLRDVVNALNKLGATPTDLMAILQALKDAGALNADLEII